MSFSDIFLKIPVAPLCAGLLAGGSFYYWAIKSKLRRFIQLRQACEPRPYFQENPMDGAFKFWANIFACMIVSAAIAWDMISSSIGNEGYYESLILPFGLPVMALHTLRWDINSRNVWGKQSNPKYHGEKLNDQAYWIEALLILACGVVFILVFDTALFIQRDLAVSIQQ